MMKLERSTPSQTTNLGWAPSATPEVAGTPPRVDGTAPPSLPPSQGAVLGAAPRVLPTAAGTRAPTTVRTLVVPSAAPASAAPSLSLVGAPIGASVERVLAAVAQAATVVRKAAERAKAGDPAPAHEAADAVGAELRTAMRAFLADRPLLSVEETFALKGLVRGLDDARGRIEADQRRILGARRASSLDLAGELVDALRGVARQAARRIEITEGQARPVRDVSAIVEQGRARAVVAGYAPTSMPAEVGFMMQDVVHHAEIGALAGYLLDLGLAQPTHGASDPAARPAHALSFARGLVSQYGRGDRAIDDVWYAAIDAEHAARTAGASAA